MSDAIKNKNKTKPIKEQYEHYDVPERYELIDGIRYDMKPSPIVIHQIIASKLRDVIDQTCSMNGLVIIAPMDVHLDEDNVVQPDIIYISETNFHIVKEKIYGSPDLLVEVLSPSSGKHDKIIKKALYEKFAIKEYWIVDPILKTIDQFMLIGHKLQLVETYGEEHILTSDIVKCINIDLSEVFAAIKRFEKLE